MFHSRYYLYCLQGRGTVQFSRSNLDKVVGNV